MLLAYYGRVYSETEIYACCETDIEGTLPSAAALCAQRLGFDASSPRLLGLEDLAYQLQTIHTFPIVSINLRPILGIRVIHALIVEAIDVQSGQVNVLDPAYPPTGRRKFRLAPFEAAWHLARYQTILVVPPPVS